MAAPPPLPRNRLLLFNWCRLALTHMLHRPQSPACNLGKEVVARIVECDEDLWSPRRRAGAAEGGMVVINACTGRIMATNRAVAVAHIKDVSGLLGGGILRGFGSGGRGEGGDRRCVELIRNSRATLADLY